MVRPAHDYAFVGPFCRLTAPHPSRGRSDPISPPQSAVLTQNRNKPGTNGTDWAQTAAQTNCGTTQSRHEPPPAPAAYRLGMIRISSVDPNPISAVSAPTAASPLSRAHEATAAATTPTTSRLNTDGMM